MSTPLYYCYKSSINKDKTKLDSITPIHYTHKTKHRPSENTISAFWEFCFKCLNYGSQQQINVLVLLRITQFPSECWYINIHRERLSTWFYSSIYPNCVFGSNKQSQSHIQTDLQDHISRFHIRPHWICDVYKTNRPKQVNVSRTYAINPCTFPCYNFSPYT